MKTAISVPDDVFEESERLAARTGKSRSQLYTEAMREYLARHDPDSVTDKINEVVDHLPPTEDRFVAETTRSLLARQVQSASGSTAMETDQALRKIAGLRPELAELGIRSLFIFGSVARGEAAGASDIDLLVEFDRPVGLFHFVRVRDFLSRELGTEVDLVTRDALSREIRDSVLREAIRAA